MRRYAQALLVCFLSFAFSGAPSVLVPEPCTLVEAPGTDEGVCLPTCAVCGCCAQAAVVMPMTVISTYQTPVSTDTQPLPLLPIYNPRKILHVPKALLA